MQHAVYSDLSDDDQDQWCKGPCMNGARRRVREYAAALAAYPDELAAWRESDREGVEPRPPEPPRVIPVYGDPVFCQEDVYAFKAKLSQLDGFACVYLREADGHRGVNDQAKVSGSSAPASPSPTIDDLDELDGWLRDWRATYLKAETSARQGTLVDSLTLGTAWLVARAERILTGREFAEEFGREINGWHGRLARASRSDVVVHRKPVRCDKCGRLSLEWKEGEDRVVCRAYDCQRRLSLDEYDAILEQEVKAAKVLASA